MEKMKEFWDKRLFLEGLRQTKWLAVIGTIACVLMPYLSFVLMNVSTVTPVLYSITSNAYIYFVPAIIFKLFSFVNKKKAADFYFSLNKKRGTIFITYISVTLFWSIMMIAAHTLSLKYVYGQGLGYEIKFQIIARSLILVLTIMGAFLVGISTTGTGFANIIAGIIILVAPGTLVNLYVSKFYELIPFIKRKGYLDGLFSDTYVSLIFNLLLGIAYLIIGYFLFKRRRAELAGVSTLNKKWQMLLRLAATLFISFEADYILAAWFINSKIEVRRLQMLILIIIIVILVWLLFDLLTELKLKKVLVAVKQLPVLIAVNVIIVLSFIISGVYYSRIPKLEEIETVRIMDYFGDENISNLEYIFEEIVFDDIEGISFIYDQMANDMNKYRSTTSYSLENEEASVNEDIQYIDDENISKDTMWVEFMVDGKPFVRKIRANRLFKQGVNEIFAKRAENIREYELPILPPDKDNIYLGDCMAFGWDMSYEELKEIYRCLYDEIISLDLPLSIFMGKDKNKEGVFDFLNYYADTDLGEISVDIPIGLDTPKTLELLANMGNERRSVAFDFDWFVNYIKNLGNEEIGGTLEIILYAGEDKNIRYESFSWWSDYTADMSDKDLDMLNSIVKSHENDGKISSDENMLVLIYKNIDGQEACGYWFNVTDEEAGKIDSLIWNDGKFERYKYKN